MLGLLCLIPIAKATNLIIDRELCMQMRFEHFSTSFFLFKFAGAIVSTTFNSFFKLSNITIASIFAILLNAQVSYAQSEIGGSAALEQRLFPEDSLYFEQADTQASLVLAPEFETNIGDGFISFKPFARLDQRDSERTHVDIRELMLAYFFDDWEVRAGVGKVFWGQTESLHLVDVINQTDFVESIDSEDKLGQPMLDIRYLLETGAISLYVLPYFRERTFPGIDGRLRGPLPIDTDNPIYESEDEETNLDFAVRWQQSIGDLELGLAYFDGTSRLPQIEMALNDIGEVALRPKYNQLQQISLDALYVQGALLIKLEAIRGKMLEQEFNAYVAGLEYTAGNFYGTGFNLGLLLEHQFDERDEQAFIFGQNDLMIGARLQLNDFAGSEVLIGFVRDLDNSSTYSASIEGSTRLNANWRLSVNGYFFSTNTENDPIYAMRRDDHITLSLEYFF